MYQIPIMPAKAHDSLGRSALPDAPVVAEQPRRHPFRSARQTLASGLHAAGRAVEPAPRRRTPAEAVGA